MNHIEELAELYALGSLEPIERSQVEAHIEHCEACRRRLGEAERVVLALAESQPQVEPLRRRSGQAGRSDLRAALRTGRSSWRFVVGLAAGLILPLLILLPVVFRANQTQQHTDVALTALVNSHFNHVAFTAKTSTAPAAKLLYARTGEWLYVIVVRPSSNLTVLVRDAQRTRTVGAISDSSPSGALFIARPGGVQEVLLAKDGAVIAIARPVFSQTVHPQR